MIPRTFPSTVNSTTGRRQMVVSFITSIVGLQRWKDYIPVKFVLDDTPTEASYNNDGYIAIDELSSISGKQSWLDYIPVYLDNSATDAWEVDANGFIQVGTSGFGGVPYSLFASGEQGAWYDPSDLNTLFQDQAGTTPVTAVEQPVSLMLDKSKGLALGSELVTNGTFDTDITGWTAVSSTLSVVSGELQCNISGASGGFTQSTINLTSGKWYKITFTYRNGTLNTTLNVSVSNSSWSTVTLNTTASTTYTAYFVATGTGASTFTVARTAVSTGTTFFDNISVKEIAGNHAYTPSTATASRPVLSARVNLLTKTEQFDDAAWTKNISTVTANTTATTDPLGGNTAEILTATASSGNIYQSVSNAASVTFKFSAYIKAGNVSSVRLLAADSTGFIKYVDATFNLLTQTVTTNSVTWSVVSTSIVSVGNGWFYCVVNFTKDGAASVIPYIAHLSSASNGNTLYIWGADLRVANDGVGIPSYQRVNTSTDYDTVGFPLYLRCDGTDDYMLTNSIDFTATDKMTVWTGVRKLSDATFQAVTELSADPNSNNGTFSIGASTISGGADRLSWALGTRGTVSGFVAGYRTYTSPITNVIAGSLQNTTTFITAKINAISNTGASADTTSTGNYGNYPLYLFRRGGTTLPFNGRCYGLVVRGAATTTPLIEATETYMNQKTRAF